MSSDSPCMLTHLAGVTKIRAGTICFVPRTHRRIVSSAILSQPASDASVVAALFRA